VYSDDHGATWSIGSAEFGAPFLVNEGQAVELRNGSVLVNARTLTTYRVQIRSDDGGITFGSPRIVPGLVEPLEGCEGSFIRDPHDDVLYYSGSFTSKLVRQNMTVLRSLDEGQSWSVMASVDAGSTSYSSLQLLPASEGNSRVLALLYERADNLSIIFEPDEIVLYKMIV